MSLVLFCERPSRRKEEEKFFEALGSWRTTKETFLNNEALRRRHKKILKSYINNVIVVCAYFCQGKKVAALESLSRGGGLSTSVRNFTIHNGDAFIGIRKSTVNFLLEL